MGFMERFFTDPSSEDERNQTLMNSFATISQNELAAHLDVKSYGDFELTEAVRPAYDLKIQPQQGYRHDVYIDEENQTRVPVIMAAASKKVLFSTFIQLVEKLGPVVDVVLETSHDSEAGDHQDLYREHIDTPVLISLLWEYENMLLNDGCTGIAVMNQARPQEVQFDEHKLLIMYGSPLEQFEFTLEKNGIPCEEEVRFLSEAEHIHSTTNDYRSLFDEFCLRLGVEQESF